MILQQAAKIEPSDVIAFSWFSLRTFQNTSFTSEAIIKAHAVPKKHFKNAEKQADQIRFFLLQAKEYFDASRTVTLVTRPVLLYYSTMCLATAEFLFKQSGDSSLDKARQSHRHHGLVFSNRNSLKDNSDTISKDATGLVALPASRENGERYGTFELWHRSARGYPTTADLIQVDRSTGSQIEGFGTVAICRDARFPQLPDKGITLLEAASNIPGMVPLLNQLGLTPNVIRGRVHSSYDKLSKQRVLSIIIHPGITAKINAFFERCLFNANDIERIRFTELNSGGILNLTYTEQAGVSFDIPSTTSCKSADTWFYTDEEHLNEFGFLYLALYIVGNYARYYPDFWIRDVEKNTKLGVLIEYLMDIAEQRVSLLTLSELSRTFYVPT